MADPEETLPQFSFLANAPAGSPLSYQALQTRRKIAEQLLGRRLKFPQGIGEGLTYLGEKIADRRMLDELAAADQQRSAALQKFYANNPLPVQGARAASVDTDTAPAIPVEDTRTATSAPEAEGSGGFNFMDAAAGPAPAGGADSLTGFIKNQEGFAPRAQWDAKQYSVGYGTKAQSPTEVITKESAEARLSDEVGKARASVESFAPNAPQGVKDALTSLTYNAGPGWQNSGLGAAVRAGDYGKAQSIFAQYNKSNGRVLPGLVSRRLEELNQYWNRPPGATIEAGAPTGRNAAVQVQAQEAPPETAMAQAPSEPTVPDESGRNALTQALVPPPTVAGIPGFTPGSATSAAPLALAGGAAPPIVVPGVKPAPAGEIRIPGPLEPPTPEQPAPEIGGRIPPNPDALKPNVKPVAPKMSAELSPLEARGVQMMRAFPGDPDVKDYAQQFIDLGKKQREADFLREVEQYKTDLAAFHQREAKDLEFERAGPERERTAQEFERKFADAKRQSEMFGGPEGEAAVRTAVVESAKNVKDVSNTSAQLANAKRVLMENPKMFTGADANIKQSLARWMAAAGFPVDPSLSPTQQFQAYIKSAYGAMRQGVAGPGGQNPAEQRAIEEAVAGNITLERGAIEKIISAMQFGLRQQAIQHNDKLLTLSGKDTNRMRAVFHGHDGFTPQRMAPLVAEADKAKLRELAKTDSSAIEEFDDEFKTPGLARYILSGGR
jgi:lysozyme